MCGCANMRIERPLLGLIDLTIRDNVRMMEILICLVKYCIVFIFFIRTSAYLHIRTLNFFLHLVIIPLGGAAGYQLGYEAC